MRGASSSSSTFAIALRSSFRVISESCTSSIGLSPFRSSRSIDSSRSSRMRWFREAVSSALAVMRSVVCAAATRRQPRTSFALITLTGNRGPQVPAATGGKASGSNSALRHAPEPPPRGRREHGVGGGLRVHGDADPVKRPVGRHELAVDVPDGLHATSRPRRRVHRDAGEHAVVGGGRFEDLGGRVHGENVGDTR